MAKLLSFKKLDNILDFQKELNETIVKCELQDETIEINVKRYIDFSSMMSFVDGVLDTVFFTDNSGETHFIPTILEYSKALSYIEYFTNLKPDMGSDRVFKIMYGTSLLRNILKNISQPQYHHIEEAIDAAITHKLAVLQMGEKAKIQNAINEIDKASQALGALTEQFDGISDEKMQTIFDKFAEMDTKELAETIIDVRDAV